MDSEGRMSSPRVTGSTLLIYLLYKLKKVAGIDFHARYRLPAHITLPFMVPASLYSFIKLTFTHLMPSIRTLVENWPKFGYIGRPGSGDNWQ